jgi:hypothetical protein
MRRHARVRDLLVFAPHVCMIQRQEDSQMVLKRELYIGALIFPTKKAAIEHFQRVLYAWDIGQLIEDPDASELGWLLERHPEYLQKCGAGVIGFSVRSALYNTRCFEVIRADESRTDFSFRSCISSAAPTPLRQLLDALRAEVAEDIANAKRRWFDENGDSEGRVVCAISGQKVAINEAHADHAPPLRFGALAVAFLAARSIEPNLDVITPPMDNQYEPRLADPTLAAEWRAYHHRIANIRVVARGANLARAHEGRIRQKDRQLKLT